MEFGDANALRNPFPDCRVAGTRIRPLVGRVRASTRLLLTFFRIAMQRGFALGPRAARGVVRARLLAEARAPGRSSPRRPRSCDLCGEALPAAVRVGRSDSSHGSAADREQTRARSCRSVIRLDNGSYAIVIKYGGTWGFGGRDIAVPLDAMVLLGEEMEVLDLTPEQLRTYFRPTLARAGAGRR
jgi:hypothetical protein